MKRHHIPHRGIVTEELSAGGIITEELAQYCVNRRKCHRGIVSTAAKRSSSDPNIKHARRSPRHRAIRANGDARCRDIELAALVTAATAATAAAAAAVAAAVAAALAALAALAVAALAAAAIIVTAGARTKFC